MNLKQRLQGTGIVTAPGVYDAFSALLVEHFPLAPDEPDSNELPNAPVVI